MWSNEIDAVDAKKEFVKFLEEYDEEHACEFSAESGRHTIDLDKLRKYCDNKDKKDLITKILIDGFNKNIIIDGFMKRIQEHMGSQTLWYGMVWYAMVWYVQPWACCFIVSMSNKIFAFPRFHLSLSLSRMVRETFTA